MIVADTLETFPTCPTYGFSVDPFILVKIIEREGGYESVDRKWAHPRRRFDGVPIGDKPQADVERILYFYLAVGGMAGEFRFKDWTDFKSCLLDEEPEPTDQPLVYVPDSPAGYQLLKQYTFGSLTYERTIRRPIGDTIRVANEVGAEQAADRWSLDEATGILTPLGGFVGTPTFWGGEFDVFARFAGPFIPEISNREIQRADVHICEKRERLPPV
jgi:uncharacterized protein (TIGR02217 family)